jgi:hypothetical protein
MKRRRLEADIADRMALTEKKTRSGCEARLEDNQQTVSIWR